MMEWVVRKSHYYDMGSMANHRIEVTMTRQELRFLLAGNGANIISQGEVGYPPYGSLRVTAAPEQLAEVEA